MSSTAILLHCMPPPPPSPPLSRSPSILLSTASQQGQLAVHVCMAGSNANTGGTATSPRSENFTPRECTGVLAAAASHWSASRGSRTGDKKRRSGAPILEAFVNATPAKDRPLARTRTADSIKKKIKKLLSRYRHLPEVEVDGHEYCPK